MRDPQYLDTPQGRRLAYHRSGGPGPGVVFLGGFVSDMQGTKAVHLEQWAQERGLSFLRFDYSGHGQSSGAFEDGSIGAWTEDALAAIAALTEGPQILVGSSMGGWIALRCARAEPLRIAGLVTIAAAPDFTEDSMWARFTPEQRARLEQDGRIDLPSDYGAPYCITQKLIEDGRASMVLRDPLTLAFPVRLLHGTADAEVDPAVALRLLDHAVGHDIRLTMVKDADHRFSTPDCLAVIEAAIDEVLARGKVQL
ncbi:alpha/beta fold hydrolase [Pseudoruegeria sp. SK021]|uniref:alpha/beta fold hydrolase n=1 Tax=Pseudoruegeria sp. SK021 TaxID=1933035 RepID=UPI000A22F687|nr:alpha/beta hydrolase [Pseudoruegeria sp. SK021]OSP54254.1 alpha/beta hydrolase [Pseudoruegeria sp. SK021]